MTSPGECPGDAACFADLFGGALVVGMGVGEREERDLAALELLEDPSSVGFAPGVYQDIADQIDVDQRGGALGESPDTFGYLLDGKTSS
jgi:hypothetical protein